ncbi:hypothetical protein B0A53_03040 [Rhodotorula sp. CCFEE 5036]|nr:hypothetical protein B0A53_03040 [Rhodotorula sp. CCFEE 5036]
MALANWYYDSGSGDWVCDDCDESFSRKGQLMKHLREDHWYCQTCDQTFGTMQARRQHWTNASTHAGRFCYVCDFLIPGNKDMDAHEEERHWFCQGCDLEFATKEARDCHGQEDHPWCYVHERAFHTQANYEAHMRSEAHVGRNQPCPFRCGGISSVRTTATASCTSEVIGGSEALTQYIATEKSYHHSRGAYVCVLCQGGFTTLRGLNAHLASPRHAYAGANGASGEKPYKCPNSACGKEFATLSGVVQHAESGACGVLQVRGMSRALDDVLGDMRRLSL